jgi:uncharacterized protein
MYELVTQAWSWWFSGIIIVAVMFTLNYFGQSFGFSSNFRTICAAAGLGKHAKLFNFDWKTQSWNLVFLVGAMIGGFVAKEFLSDGTPVLISEATIADLAKLGLAAPSGLQPEELFGWDAMLSVKGFSVLALGGLLIGFGSRYAGGCTSGHAISGLSNLQLPSLIAVIGFFIGGLIMTFFILPVIL